MGFMNFRVDDQSTDGTPQPAIWVRLEETAAGQILMTVTVDGPLIGDLRGVFFDLADESLIGSLTATATTGLTELRQGNDTVRDLGDGANLKGLTGSDAGFDVGLEIGTAGIAKDDIRSFSAILGSDTRPLTLADFANVEFGVRSTSVGTIGSSRSDSSKLLETTFTAITAQDDGAMVDENEIAEGNLLDNDRTGLAPSDTVAVTGWNGGSLGDAVTLAGTEGATLVVNADGSYTLDASVSNALSAGESFTFHFNYNALQTSEATASAGDSGTFTVTVNGANDGPVAANDVVNDPIDEGGSATIDVLANDSDVDRLDSISVVGVQNGNGDFVAGPVTLASGATVTLDNDGTFTYATGTAFDALAEGDTTTDTFTYQIADGNGGFDTAMVTVTIHGADDTDGGTGEVVGDSTPPVDQYPSMRQDISNVVLYLDDGNPFTQLMKVKITPQGGLDLRDVDLLQLPQFLATHGAALNGHTTLVALSIHAGQEYPNVAGQDGTRNGEGAFYLMTGDATPIAPIGSHSPSDGWTHDWTTDDYPLPPDAASLGLSLDLLGAAVDYEYIFSDTWPVVVSA